jgi:Holliday junction resolvase RusA-like endonuclease
MQITFTIPGNPVGKGRPKFARRGKFTVCYTPEKTASYENLVKIAAANAMLDRAPMDEAVSIELMILVTPPASWSNKKRMAALNGITYPTTKPDIDNVLKCICDSCNGIVFLDDKQVVDCVVSKRYAEKAGCVVIVKSL